MPTHNIIGKMQYNAYKSSHVAVCIIDIFLLPKAENFILYYVRVRTSYDIGILHITKFII